MTDGKAGDENPAIGVAEALGAAFETRHVAPRAPWHLAMPWGPIDPAEAPDKPASPIAPPYPELVLASGRRAVAYARVIRREAGDGPVLVFLKDPRTAHDLFDLIWVPSHDRRRGANIIDTLTAPHRLGPERLAAARADLDPAIAALPTPRLAVVLGGDVKGHPFGKDAASRLADHLAALAPAGGSVLITPSRRTPDHLLQAVDRATAAMPRILWDGSGPNPYIGFLAAADVIVVTGDSHNLVSETLATGAPVHLFCPDSLPIKLKTFADALFSQGLVHDFQSGLETGRHQPLDSTLTIAHAIRTIVDRKRG